MTRREWAGPLRARALPAQPVSGGEVRKGGPGRGHRLQNRPGTWVTGAMAFGQEVLPMPWKETCPMDERLAFIADYRRRDSSMRALCRAYGISRKTGYKVLGRYHADGATGLGDRSRAPHRHPQALRAAVRTAILQLRGAHPYWGPASCAPGSN